MKKTIKKIAGAILCVMGAFVIFAIAYGMLYATRIPEKNPERNETATELSVTRRDSGSFILAPRLREDMLEDALKSVVGISSADAATGETEDTWYMGSGVLVSEDGYIITNHHVIGARPKRIVVTLHDGSVTEGTTVWSESSLDLAIVKIEGNGYTYSKLGDAGKLRVGESVVAIGNPLSMQFQRTVTAGIVSAMGRSISIDNEDGTSSYMEDLIQTDASINPGNSGGPLLNDDGEIVGINTVKVSTAEGMGFAVPVNVCVPIMKRLRSTGSFRTPYLGLYAYTPAAARYLEENENIRQGLFVAKLDTKGPAFEAGIRYGDIITAAEEVDVNSMLTLREQLYKKQGGDKIRLEIIRDGNMQKIDVILSSVK